MISGPRKSRLKRGSRHRRRTFSALLASVHRRDEEGADGVAMRSSGLSIRHRLFRSRISPGARGPRELRNRLFLLAVRRACRRDLAQLTVSVTTKLARLLQEQAVREVAVNRIATAIRSTLELPSVLQTTVDEVGRALAAQHCALSVEGEHGGEALVNCYFRDGEVGETDRAELVSDLGAYSVRLGSRLNSYVQDGNDSACAADGITQPLAVVPAHSSASARWAR